MSDTTTPAAVTIDFSEIPSPWQVPGSYLEVLPGYQNVGVLPFPARALIVGQMAGGLAMVNQVIQNVTREIDARAYGGAGSQIDLMASSYLATGSTIPLDIIAVADAAGATAAVWIFRFGGSPAQGGTAAVGIAGQRVYIGALAGDSIATSAAEFATAINAMSELPVTATAAAGAVTVTAKNAGLSGNDISMVVNPTIGDTLPPGMSLTIAQIVQGATNPDSASVIAAISQTWYTDVMVAWQDQANIDEWEAETERRFNAMVHMDMRVHFGVTGSLSQMIAKCAATNGRFIYFSPMTAPGTPPCAIAASAGGICAQRLTNDPSRQLDEIVMPGIVGPQGANVPDDDEKELLLAAGGSVFRVLQNSTVTMERYVSTYTFNALYQLDPAWHDIMEQAVASRIRYDWKSYFRSLYPSNKLAPDGSLAAQADSTVCTPNRAKASWGARMMVYAQQGWVVDEVNQAAAAVFTIDASDGNRLDYRIPYKRIGNLIVDAGQLVFQV